MANEWIGLGPIFKSSYEFLISYKFCLVANAQLTHPLTSGISWLKTRVSEVNILNIWRKLICVEKKNK